MVFGPSAALDVGGAFRASTADYIRLADGVIFSAVPGAGDLLLSSAAPQAFGFLNSNPAPILLDGAQLLVDPGQTLSLVGGDVQMNGAVLLAPSGIVEIGSAASPGVASFDSGLDMSQFSRLGEVRITGGGIAVGDGFSPGGSIVIRSGQLIVEAAAVVFSDTADLPGAPIGIDIQATDSMIVRDGSLIQTFSAGAADASDIVIRAGNLTVTGLDPGLGITSAIESQGLAGGKTGTVNIQVGNALLSDRGAIRTVAAGGNAGDISVAATGTVTLTGAQSEIGSGVGGGAPSAGQLAGNISVTAADVVLQDFARIRSGEPGNSEQGGNVVSVSATNTVSISGLAGILSAAFLENVGRIEVSAPQLVMNGGYINTSTLSNGNAGQIVVNANSISLTNGAQIASSSQGAATGAGGAIALNAPSSVTISGIRGDDGVGLITLTNSRSSGLFSTTEGSARAGQISVSHADAGGKRRWNDFRRNEGHRTGGQHRCECRQS